MNSNLDIAIKKQLEDETPLGKIGKPEDISRAVNWLIEDEYVTGQIIPVNGGWAIL